MPTFAELREQAKKAGSMAGSQVNSLRDRFNQPASSSPSSGGSHSFRSGSISSPPPMAKKPPMPPPVRGAGGAPPPPMRTPSSPDAPPAMPARGLPPSLPSRTQSSAPSHVSAGSAPGGIDWANLTEDDKYAFFSLLDEYFARRGLHDAPAGAQGGAPVSTPFPFTGAGSHAHQRAVLRTNPSQTHTRAALDSQQFHLDTPPTSMTSATICEFFLPSTHWPSAWYEDKKGSLPPPVVGSKDVQGGGRWSSYGDEMTRIGYVLFADLSVLWYRVQWNSQRHDPNSVQREAMYRPPPEPWSSDLLRWANELYGEELVAFAENSEAAGQPIGRGECWDLAHSGLQSILTNPATAHFPKPVQSISRTHGHLFFAGSGAANYNAQVGRWRGGDDRVRRGDIVEWNRVKIQTTDGGRMTLGDPEHTAIIVAVPDEPIPSAADGADVKPYELGWLEVVEQSKAHPPMRRRYDMSKFSEGKVWIYRPVPDEYIGPGLTAEWPPQQPAYSL
ncbi:hypothetical protein CALCODRAFT_259471 [Calocera cornea HHB12733]|uniref:BBC1/AIM3 cysteine proteinase-fold domain-containing protein n=1 Tax=Calocera cornea HHB12733 TaxID=1353952 RepID=A0A165GHB9_9BASI|nr:hypothetical protein CALCODRAFT_259471 [Calocera cornea HHB12733]